MKKIMSKIKRNVALATSLFFLAQQAGAVPFVYAAPETAMPAAGVTIDIPADMGSIEANIQNSADAPLVVHIQDAHGNYDAQKSIQKILGSLSSSGKIDAVMLEGGKGEIKPEVLNLFPGRPELNLQVADNLAKKSQLGGAEIFLLERYLSGNPVPAYGLEDAGTYRINRESFQKVLRAKRQSGEFLKGMDLQIERLTSPHVNPALKKFLRDYESYETGHMLLPVWLGNIKELSSKYLGLNLENPVFQKEWPMMVRYVRLRSIESKLKNERMEDEKAALLKVLENEKVSKPVRERFASALNFPADKTLSSAPSGELLESLKAVIAELPVSFSFEAYPSLKAFIQFSVFRQELKSDVLFDEIESLELKLSDRLAKTETEKKLVRLHRDYRMLKKLFELELARENYVDIIQQEVDLKPSSIARRFQALNENKRVKNADFDHLPEIDAMYELALEFYRGVLDRDRLMADSVLRTMSDLKKKNIAIITGGFHSEGMKKYFEAKGFSYVLISPQITEITGREDYLRAMLDETEVTNSKISDVPIELPANVVLELAGQATVDRQTAAVYAEMVNVVTRSEVRSRKDWIFGIGILVAVGLATFAAWRSVQAPPVQPPQIQVVEVIKEVPVPVEKEEKPAPKVEVPEVIKPPAVVVPEVVPEKEKEPVIDPAEKKRVWGEKEPPKISPKSFDEIAKSKYTPDQIRWILKYEKRSRQLENEVAKKNQVWTVEHGVRHITEDKLTEAEKKEYSETKPAIESFMKELKDDKILTGNPSELDLYYFFFKPLFVVQDRHGKSAASLVNSMSVQYMLLKGDFEIGLSKLDSRSISSTYARTFEDYLNPDEWKSLGGDRLKIALALSLLNAQLDTFKEIVWRNHEWSRFKKLEIPAELELFRFYNQKGLGKEALESMEMDLKAEMRGPGKRDTVRDAWRNKPNFPQRQITYLEDAYSRTWYYSAIHAERFNRPGNFALGATPNPWFPTHTLIYFHVTRMPWVKTRAEDVTGVSREPYFISPAIIRLPSKFMRENRISPVIAARPDSIWGAVGLGDRTQQRAEDVFSFFLANPSAWKAPAKGELQYLDNVFDAQSMKDFSVHTNKLGDSGHVKALYLPDYGDFLINDFLQSFIDREYLSISNGQLKGNEAYIEKLATALRAQYAKLPPDFQVYLQIPLLRYEAGKNLKLDDDYMSYLRADLYQSAAQFIRDVHITNRQALVGSAYKQGIKDSEGINNYVRYHVVFRPIVERLLGRPLVLTNPYSEDSGRLSAFVNEIYKRGIDPDIWLLINQYAVQEAPQRQALELYNAVLGTTHARFNFNVADNNLAAIRLGTLLSNSAETILDPEQTEKIKTFFKDEKKRRQAIEFGVRFYRVYNKQRDLTGDALKREIDQVEKDMREEKNTAVIARYLGYIIGQGRTAVEKKVLDDERDYQDWVETTDAVIKALDGSRKEVRFAPSQAEVAGQSAEARLVVEVLEGIIPAGMTGAGDGLFEVIFKDDLDALSSGTADLSDAVKKEVLGLLGISGKAKQPDAVYVDSQAGITRGLLAALRDVLGNTVPIVVFTSDPKQEQIVADFNKEVLAAKDLRPILTAKTVKEAEDKAKEFLKDLGATVPGTLNSRAMLDLSESDGPLADELRQKQVDILLLTEQMYDKMAGIAGIEALLTAFKQISERISSAA